MFFDPWAGRLRVLAVGSCAYVALIALLRKVRRVVASEPAQLLHEGEFLRATMRRERVNEDEVRQAPRKEGVEDPAVARAVVLGSDGTFSVIAASE